jgi:uncharacterized membrane protein
MAEAEETKVERDLLSINVLTLFLILIISCFPSTPLRIVLGLPFGLFFPGYTLTAALFPKKEGLGGIWRVALSFGLSIAMIPLIGLIFDYAPWGITLYPILVSLAVFILFTSAIAWYRRRRLPPKERFSVPFLRRLPAPKWRGAGRENKALYVVLGLSIAFAIGSIAYSVVAPTAGEKFTEFYILGSEGGAADYPKELLVGEEGNVTIGIVDHEHEQVTYRVEIWINGNKEDELSAITLDHGQRWEHEVSFSFQEAGPHQEVSFLLFKQGQSDPYGTLHLFVNVTL